MPIPVSVVIPVHNGGAYLEQALDSVIAQTFGAFELLVIDDGSTDGSAALARQVAARDARVQVISKPKSGLTDTLNRGLGEARGDWIARLDADDLMAPNRLERQIAFVEAEPALAAAGSYYHIIDSRGGVRGTRFPRPRTRAELERRLDRREILAFTHPTMIFRRAVALALGGYRKECEPCEDADLFARMLQSGRVVLIQPEVLTFYRVHGDSISSRRAAEMGLRTRFIYHNLHRERAGLPPVDYAAYLAFLRAGPLARRMKLAAELASERLLDRHTRALVADRPVAATLLLAAAAALKPVKAVRRGLASLQPRSAGRRRAA